MQQSFLDQASKDVGHAQPAKGSVKEENPPTPPPQPNNGAVAPAPSTVAPPAPPVPATEAISTNDGDDGNLSQKQNSMPAPKVGVNSQPQKEHTLAATLPLPPFANNTINSDEGRLKPAISSENLIDLDGATTAVAITPVPTIDTASAGPILHASIHSLEHECETSAYAALMSNSHSNLADILQQPLIPQQMQTSQPVSSAQSPQPLLQQQQPLPVPPLGQQQQQQQQQASPLDLSSLGIALERKDTETPSEEAFVDADDGLEQ